MTATRVLLEARGLTKRYLGLTAVDNVAFEVEAGAVVGLGEIDCSAQRSGVTVIGETPAPGLTRDTRENLMAAAIRIGKAVRYRSAGLFTSRHYAPLSAHRSPVLALKGRIHPKAMPVILTTPEEIDVWLNAPPLIVSGRAYRG